MMQRHRTAEDVWPTSCTWCGAPLHQHGTGRPRRYCRPACRQRAYERRKVERAVQPVQRQLEQASWRLQRLRADLTDLLREVEPILHKPGARPSRETRLWCETIEEVADPVRFAARHGHPPVGTQRTRLRIGG